MSLLKYKCHTRHLLATITQAFIKDCCCELCLGPIGQPGHSPSFLCQACFNDLPAIPPSCSHCSEPLSHPKAGQTHQRCLRCQLHPPEYDYSHYRFLFQSPVDLWIRAAKDKRQEHWLGRLSELMLDKPPASLSRVDGLVVIPSHWLARWKRGYNPAEILTRQISHRTGIPIIRNALHKRYARDQRHLSAKERHRNLAHTLLAGQQTLDQAHILVIDDVMTTGATASAAAVALKQQGASIVGIWALARTPPARFMVHNAASITGGRHHDPL